MSAADVRRAKELEKQAQIEERKRMLAEAAREVRGSHGSLSTCTL